MEHELYGLAVGEERPQGVDLHHTVPTFVRTLVQGAVTKPPAADPGDVEEDVKPLSQKVPDLLEQERDLEPAAGIERPACTRAERPERDQDRRVERYGVAGIRFRAPAPQPGNDDPRPFLEEPPRGSQANPAGPP